MGGGVGVSERAAERTDGRESVRAEGEKKRDKGETDMSSVTSPDQFPTHCTPPQHGKIIIIGWATFYFLLSFIKDVLSKAPFSLQDGRHFRPTPHGCRVT